MFDSPDIFLTRAAAEKIADAATDHGEISLVHNEAEDFYRVSVVEIGAGVRIPVPPPKSYAVLGWDGPSYLGHWLKRSADDLNLIHRDLMIRPSVTISLDDFRGLVPEVIDPGNLTGFLITYDANVAEHLKELGVEEYAGWLITRSGVRPIQLELEPKVIGLAQLDGLWPIGDLSNLSVMLVGCGSIGGTAAAALARYGVGTVHLVDPDRMRWHNTLRHTLGPESVGSFKASALSRELSERWTSQVFPVHKVDVVSSAHEIRPLLTEIDLVVCTADGIAARRVISHLARRAGKPAILACVLDDGAVGEVIRFRPTPKFGCLLCLRAYLSARGAMDAEAAQELDYGTGRVHLPMSAVPPDLHLLGILAAKFAVATLLESRFGDDTQRIPNEYAIVGLRPRGDLAAPFDLAYAASIEWSSLPEPRADCPTCNP